MVLYLPCVWQSRGAVIAPLGGAGFVFDRLGDGFVVVMCRLEERGDIVCTVRETTQETGAMIPSNRTGFIDRTLCFQSARLI